MIIIILFDHSGIAKLNCFIVVGWTIENKKKVNILSISFITADEILIIRCVGSCRLRKTCATLCYSFGKAVLTCAILLLIVCFQLK